MIIFKFQNLSCFARQPTNLYSRALKFLANFIYLFSLFIIPIYFIYLLYLFLLFFNTWSTSTKTSPTSSISKMSTFQTKHNLDMIINYHVKNLHLVSLITIEVNVKNAARRLFESERSDAAPSVLMSLPTVRENRYPYEENSQKIGTSNSRLNKSRRHKKVVKWNCFLSIPCYCANVC